MTHGIDTDFLVAVEVVDHPFHDCADALLDELIDEGHDFALAPQTLGEFIHVVTDGKRMPTPLPTEDAISRAERWWHAEEVIHVFPSGRAVCDFFAWLKRYQLGRKRLNDTLLASCLRGAGVPRIISNNNRRDFQVLEGFDVIEFK